MKNGELQRSIKFFSTTFGIALAAIAIVALATQFKIHVSNEWQEYYPMPHAVAPGKSNSIIVFAPHSDDETLGCGGMISMAHANGAKVRVVLFTNGDGFRIAVGRAFKTLKVTPAKCIKFAYRRQGESLKALKKLGLPSHNVTFLGYPDRGIERLWENCWSTDNLYFSHATGWDRSPYVNSFTKNAPYCGESLISDVEKILKQTKPTDIYIPHSADNHPDHFATYCFVMAAIEQLEAEGYKFASNIKPHTYLVHRGDWPLPKGDHPTDPLAPPYALARGDTKWESLQLSPDVVAKKRQAIKEYKTQTAVERGFMMSFARKNEIYGDMPKRTIAESSNIKVDGDPEDWSGIPPVVVDPVGDYVLASMNKGGDIHAIYLATDSKFLYFRLDCARKLSKRIRYNINFRGLSGSQTNDRYTVSLRPPFKIDPPNTTWAHKGHIMEIAIPMRQLSFDRDLFVRVDTKMMKLTVDNTGWNGFKFARENKKLP